VNARLKFTGVQASTSDPNEGSVAFSSSHKCQKNTFDFLVQSENNLTPLTPFRVIEAGIDQ
jgi:hypothetical protein